MHSAPGAWRIFGTGEAGSSPVPGAEPALDIKSDGGGLTVLNLPDSPVDGMAMVENALRNKGWTPEGPDGLMPEAAGLGMRLYRKRGAGLAASVARSGTGRTAVLVTCNRR